MTPYDPVNPITTDLETREDIILPEDDNDDDDDDDDDEQEIMASTTTMMRSHSYYYTSTTSINRNTPVLSTPRTPTRKSTHVTSSSTTTTPTRKTIIVSSSSPVTPTRKSVLSSSSPNSRRYPSSSVIDRHHVPSKLEQPQKQQQQPQRQQHKSRIPSTSSTPESSPARHGGVTSKLEQLPKQQQQQQQQHRHPSSGTSSSRIPSSSVSSTPESSPVRPGVYRTRRVSSNSYTSFASTNSTKSSSVATTATTLSSSSHSSCILDDLVRYPELKNVQDIAVLINAERKKRNIYPLERSPQLDYLANEHCQLMASYEEVFHSVNTIHDLQMKLSSLKVGENIQRGNAIQDMHSVTMTCPNQLINKNNILSTQFTEFGSAIHIGKDGKIYSCQLFRRISY